MTSRRPAALVTLALAALGLAAPAAHAGTFRVSQCNAVDQGGLSARGMQASLWWVAGGYLASSCGMSGGRLAFEAPGHRLHSDTALDGGFSVPPAMPSTTLLEAWLDWSSTPQAPSTNPAYFVVTSAGARVIQHRAGAGTPPGAAERLALPAGARAIEFTTWCSPHGGPGWCNWSSHVFELRGMTVTLEESRPPDVRAGGPLVAPGDRAGAEPLWIDATDGDSGVRRVAVTLGGVAVAAVELAADCRDDRLPPCPQAVRRTVDVDTARVPDGAHRLRLLVTDAAGNQQTADAATVHVRNRPAGGAPPAPAVNDAAAAAPGPGAGSGASSGAGAAARGRIHAWLEPRRGARRRAVRVAAGRRLRVRGRVWDAAGRPAGGLTLSTVERVPGRRPRVRTGLRSGPDGRFTAIARTGTSRSLRFVHGAPAVETSSRTLRVAVRAPVFLRAWRAGATVRIRGRLRGGHVPRGGALVELQRRAGGRWTGVGALRTTRTGRFAARLNAPRAPLLRLRAVAPGQPGLPYATGRSPTARVR